GVSVGAPPDEFNTKGQDWGLPPVSPRRLRDHAFAPFIATLRANMARAGALRIDHVMGLARLYWIPRGASPAEGAYVRYPPHDLPTLAGWWQDEDLRTRASLGLMSAGELRDQGAERHAARGALVEALAKEGLVRGGAISPDSGFSEELALAVQEFLARTPAC